VPRGRQVERHAHWTTRELAILRLLSEGKTNREIGTSLGLAEQTVKNYIARMCQRIGATNRVQLLTRAPRATDETEKSEQ
jgi:DNA-binding NarL/FixJ family response regulator